jgi:hypothetical protein
MRRSHVRCLVVVVGALATVCVLAEGVARLLTAPLPYSAIYQRDPALGYRFVAGTAVGFAVGADRYRVEFDGDGVIDRAGPRPEQVVILGDGVVAGLELPAEQRIARLIASAGRAAAVNLAVPGYGLLQEVLRLEQWLANHEPPRFVVVVQNFANDVVDNVPEWEGVEALPGVGRRGDSSLELIPPRLPTPPYRWASSAAHASHLYGLYQAARWRPPEPRLPDQQRWLYAKDPPRELERGLQALRWSGQRLRMLAGRHRFAVVVVDWVDWPLVWSAVDDPVERQRMASARVQQAIGYPTYSIEALVPAPAQIARWSTQWVIASTRHANSAGTAALAGAIVTQLGSRNE